MAYDPVCLAPVDEDDAQFRSTFRDREYYFCTNYCKKKFEENPKRYTRISCDLDIGSGDTSC